MTKKGNTALELMSLSRELITSWMHYVVKTHDVFDGLGAFGKGPPPNSSGLTQRTHLVDLGVRWWEQVTGAAGHLHGLFGGHWVLSNRITTRIRTWKVDRGQVVGSTWQMKGY